MPEFEYHLFPYLSDNYGVLVHDPKSGVTAAVDAGEPEAYLDALSAKGWKLNELWITHHHWDHTDGLAAIKEATGCLVRGPNQKSKPIAGLDEHYWDGDWFEFAGQRVNIIATPGHTTDMINYYISDEGVVFTGDTLFTLGCGRIFEGTPEMMWESMQKLMALPAETIVYSAHEYTLANAKFALSVDSSNVALATRAEEIAQMRQLGLPTVPSTIGQELATNPFLRATDPAIRKQLGMANASDGAVFAEVRRLKDGF